MRFYGSIAVVAALLIAAYAENTIGIGKGGDTLGVRMKNRFCDASDSSPCSGRGNCTADGQCECQSGYVGARCHRECRPSASNICSGHGTCSSVTGRCSCSAGYAGKGCETELPTPSQLETVSAPQATNDSVVLSWPEPSNQNQGGSSTFQGTTYVVEVCEASLDCSSGASQSVSLAAMRVNDARARTQETSNWQKVCETTDNTCQASGLKAGTAYKARVSAKFRNGVLNDPTEIEVVTQAEAPDYESNLPIVNKTVTDTSILVELVPPRDIGGSHSSAAIDEYKVEYRKVGESAFQSKTVTAAQSGATQTNLTGLDVFSTYEIRSSAKNDAGYGSPSGTVQQKTAGRCGNGHIESGSLGNGLTYVEQCETGHCCSSSCLFKPDSYCSGHGSCSNATHCACTGSYIGVTCQYSDATTCSGHGTVSYEGTCSCQSGYGGSSCTACSDGSYSSSGNCVPCGCDSSGSTSTVCDKTTGQCPCKTGYYGRTCSSAYTSCKAIKDAIPASSNGVYAIKPASSSSAMDVYCDMTNGGYTLIAKMRSDTSVWQYDSDYWQSGTTVGSQTPSLSVADIKYLAFMHVSFTTVRGCVGSATTNCMHGVLSSTYSSAHSLFSGSYVPATLNQAEILQAFSVSPRNCDMQGPGFNSVRNGNNRARFGFVNNIPSQACQTSLSDDADGAIGFGLHGQDCCPMNVGYTNYFAYNSPNAGRESRRTGWLWVK